MKNVNFHKIIPVRRISACHNAKFDQSILLKLRLNQYVFLFP